MKPEGRSLFWCAFSCICALSPLSCSDDSPSVSGATNWLRCNDANDCSSHPQAICSEDGYCLDEAGQRIVVDEPPTSGRVVLSGILTDEAGQHTIMAQWDNGTDQTIYLRGCSTTDGLYLEDGTWQRYGAFVQCTVEGPAVELAPGERYQDVVGASAPPERGDGVWRLQGPYGIGCNSGQELSLAGCTEVIDLESENEVSW